jgi:hypothetical protein
MAPGTIVALAGLGGYSYENMKKTPPSPTRIGELIVALAGIGWNIRTLLKMEHQEPQNPPQK